MKGCQACGGNIYSSAGGTGTIQGLASHPDSCDWIISTDERSQQIIIQFQVCKR